MSPKSQRRNTTAFSLLAVGLMLACGVASPEPPPGVDATKAALQLQSTAMSLQLTQSALNSRPQVQPTNLPPPTPTENAPAPTETAPAPAQVLPTPTADLEARIKSAKIVVYENTDEYNIGMWVQDALDGLGLSYTQTGSYSGRFMQNLNSGVKYDLIIVDAEGKDKISGEFWDAINTRLVRDKAALIVEVWYLHREANGPISKILSGCGIRYRIAHPTAESIYWWVPDHPVFNEPNTALPLLNYFQYWSIKSGGDGDKLMLRAGGDATLLAGLSAKPSSGEGVVATCYQGRVIIQTFSDHDFRQGDIIPLWQNYIHYTLKNHFAVTP
jgi:hypothetical protein